MKHCSFIQNLIPNLVFQKEWTEKLWQFLLNKDDNIHESKPFKSSGKTMKDNTLQCLNKENINLKVYTKFKIVYELAARLRKYMTLFEDPNVR